jgi:hypothetical protein
VAETNDSEVKSELRLLDQLLGETRSRFHRRQTPFASSERLIELDREIRQTLARTPAPGLESEARRLIDRLRALDPH